MKGGFWSCLNYLVYIRLRSYIRIRNYVDVKRRESLHIAFGSAHSCVALCSLGFGVWGLGFRVWGSGVGAEGLGFGVWGVGFRV